MKKQKTAAIATVSCGAGNQNRTDDLVITNDVLYRLSHTSIGSFRLCYYTKEGRFCQEFFEKSLKNIEWAFFSPITCATV